MTNNELIITILEKIIYPKMEREASKGYDNAFIRMSFASCFEGIKEILTAQGFKVTYRNEIVSVYWTK